MKDKPECPHWDKKNQKCKLVSAKQNEINRPLDIIYQINEIIEGFLPPKTSLGPVPGSHGQIEGHNPIPLQPPPGMLEGLNKIASKIFYPPTDSQSAHFEEVEKKQEYWEKELEKMDEKKKK